MQTYATLAELIASGHTPDGCIAWVEGSGSADPVACDWDDVTGWADAPDYNAVDDDDVIDRVRSQCVVLNGTADRFYSDGLLVFERIAPPFAGNWVIHCVAVWM